MASQGGQAGSLRLQRNLGLKPARGEGAPRDLAEAIKWHELAAEQGRLDSKRYPGRMLIIPGFLGLPPLVHYSQEPAAYL